MNKDKIRALLNEFFKSRDLDKDLDKLYPLFNRKRLSAVLDGTQDFNKSDILVILSVAFDVAPDRKMTVEKESLELINKIKEEVGTLGSVVGH